MTTIPGLSPKGQHGVRGGGVWMIPRGTRRMAVSQSGASRAVLQTLGRLQQRRTRQGSVQALGLRAL